VAPVRNFVKVFTHCSLVASLELTKSLWSDFSFKTLERAGRRKKRLFWEVEEVSMGEGVSSSSLSSPPSSFVSPALDIPLSESKIALTNAPATMSLRRKSEAGEGGRDALAHRITMLVLPVHSHLAYSVSISFSAYQAPTGLIHSNIISCDERRECGEKASEASRGKVARSM
jgi:hypothetical protein